MEENYINIFTTYLANLLEGQKMELKDVILLVKEFEPISDGVKSRLQLIDFLDKHINKYWELKELKKQLLDPSHKFKLPEV